MSKASGGSAWDLPICQYKLGVGEKLVGDVSYELFSNP